HTGGQPFCELAAAVNKLAPRGQSLPFPHQPRRRVSMQQVDLREGARRQDRVVALYAVLQCWVRGLDGVFFLRAHLLRLLGLDRFKETRVSWLQEDFQELFPYQEVFITERSKSLGYLLVSRKRFVGVANNLPQRLEACEANNIAVAKFELWRR